MTKSRAIVGFHHNVFVAPTHGTAKWLGVISAGERERATKGHKKIENIKEIHTEEMCYVQH